MGISGTPESKEEARTEIAELEERQRKNNSEQGAHYTHKELKEDNDRLQREIDELQGKIDNGNLKD